MSTRVKHACNTGPVLEKRANPVPVSRHDVVSLIAPGCASGCGLHAWAKASALPGLARASGGGPGTASGGGQERASGGEQETASGVAVGCGCEALPGRSQGTGSYSTGNAQRNPTVNTVQQKFIAWHTQCSSQLVGKAITKLLFMLPHLLRGGLLLPPVVFQAFSFCTYSTVMVRPMNCFPLVPSSALIESFTSSN